MIIHHQDNVTAFTGNHTVYWMLQPLFFQRISATSAAAPGRVMGLVTKGGLAGENKGLVG